MTDREDELPIQERLALALDRGQLPAGGAAEAAERLIERLDRPVRLAVVGLPGAGKTAVLNVLAGDVVVPSGLRMPTLVVQRGDEERTVCTLADGSTVIFAGRALTEAIKLKPALITLELNLPSLSVINLMEVGAGPSEADQRRALGWIAKRADFLIWCSPAFLPKEQVLWEEMPDAVKDNGFLLITKTDLLGGQEAISGLMQRVEARAAEEFRHMFPISTRKARQAIGQDGKIDRAVFRDSGAAAVISAIKARVDSARRADTDTAELLLARHSTEAQRQRRKMPGAGSGLPPLGSGLMAEQLSDTPRAAAPRPSARVMSAPPRFSQKSRELDDSPSPPPPVQEPPARSRTIKPEKVAPPTFTPPAYEPPLYKPPSPPQRTLAGLSSRVVRTPPVAPATPPAPPSQPLLLVPKAEVPAEKTRSRAIVKPGRTPTATLREVISPDDRKVVESALQLMRERAAEVAALVEGAAKLPITDVVEHTRATADLLEEAISASKGRQIRRIATDLSEVQDLMMLMQMEKGAGPAEDTLTLLLQIRRDLETIVAA